MPRSRARPGEVLLCAASKTQNSETVRAAAALDIDLFGENRVQELCEKYAAGAYSGKPLHFIGHLQTNKVRQVVGRACMIESVGSHRLLECVAAEAQKQGIRQDILVEINIGAEASKSGIAPEELPGLLECAHALPSLRVRGLMSIRLLRMRRARAAPTLHRCAACSSGRRPRRAAT